MMASPLVEQPLISLPEDNLTLAPYSETKVATIIVTPDDLVKVEVEEGAFPAMPRAELMRVLESTFRTASLKTLEDSRDFEEDVRWTNVLTPINEGSLYDGILFEVGIYINSYSHVVANPTFGKQCSPQVKLSTSLRRVSDTLLFLAEQAGQQALAA